jgi:hypothetical protein
MGRIAVLAAGLLMAGVHPAWAHGLAQRYDLPIPLGFYLIGAGLVVALSFVLAGLFLRRATLGGAAVACRFAGRMLTHPAACAVAGALSLAVFVLVVASGFAGDQSPLRNPLPLFVWILWWVGFTLFVALVGNVWPALNPWRLAFTAAERVAGPLRLGWRYPPWLGTWPAVAFFLIFVAIELAWPGGERPYSLAWAIVLYSIVTWLGMAAFGPETWLEEAEIFSVFFSVAGRFAPLALEQRGQGPALVLRVPGSGLANGPAPVSLSRLVFVTLMLASVTYDGLLETPPVVALQEEVTEALSRLLLAKDHPGASLVPESVLAAAGLPLFALAFLALYAVTAAAMGWASGRALPFHRTAFAFVLSLVPIAIAYHFAHYLWFFLVAGQYMIPVLSDPFGLRWDLFGTTLYRVRIGVVDARFAWYAAVASIIIGHVLAVLVAHRMALRLYGDGRAATRSQIPMLFLMVGYTMTSLWILAQPIVN